VCTFDGMFSRVLSLMVMVISVAFCPIFGASLPTDRRVEAPGPTLIGQGARRSRVGDRFDVHDACLVERPAHLRFQ
jgi:hypothetical protein